MHPAAAPQPFSLSFKEILPGRLTSIDLLRGLVMVIMALDHTRDYFSGATFDPTDLTKTNALWFLTRWITHFCAPVFVFLTGSGAYLAFAKGGWNCTETAAFLLKRGLWLVFLEIGVISPLGWAFSLDFAFTRLQVIWVIGISMIILAALIQFLPPRAIAGLGLALILFHNLFDRPHNSWFGPFEGIWRTLNGFAFFEPFAHKRVASLYALVPWTGVMALGFGAGELFRLAPKRQRQILSWAGLAMLAAFVAQRISNLYGDPNPWAPQESSTLTLLSVLNTTKHPPSLLYLLMTLGPAALVLAWAGSLPQWIASPAVHFGRVPLFYYLLHLPLIHGLAVLFSYARDGGALWLLQDPFAARGSAHPFPPGYGYDLWVVYVVWIGIVVALYPACKWYGDFKKRNRHPLLAYL
jgi:uncharacterized membrane protein